MSIVDDLEDAIRTFALSSYANPSAELVSMDLNSLLTVWFSYRDRLVEPRPRAIHKSTELTNRSLSPGDAAGLASVEAELAAGTDISPRLSRQTATQYVPSSERGSLRSRRDLDLLMSDWGIHHLHLSPTLDGGRTQNLLFLIVYSNDAFLIDILDHGHWTDVGLIEVVVRNWPTLMPVVTGVQLAQPISNSDRKRLREGGVAVLVEVDGKIVFPRGMTTAGTAIASTVRADGVARSLVLQRSLILQDEDSLNQQVITAGGPDRADRTWTPFVRIDGYGFEDTTSGDILLLGALQ